jgi:alkylhydroperoxidase family enzyme
MYLKDLARRDPPESAGRFATSIRAARAAGGQPPGIHLLFAARPSLARHLGATMQDLMRGPGPIPPGRRELIAAWTSARNHCLF